MTKGLKFLSKKHWHPSTIKNSEQVWLAEQKQAEEARKIAEYKKQLQEEREVQRVRNLQNSSSGGQPYQERLDWMYEVPAAKYVSSDDYLTGKVTATLDDGKSDLTKLRESNVPGTNFITNTTTQANDTFRRIAEDPMMAVKKKEIESRQKVLSNPILLRQARQKALPHLSREDKLKFLELLNKDLGIKDNNVSSVTKQKSTKSNNSRSRSNSIDNSNRRHKNKHKSSSHHRSKHSRSSSSSSSTSISRSRSRSISKPRSKYNHRRNRTPSESRSPKRNKYNKHHSKHSKSRSRSRSSNRKALTAEEKAEKLRQMELDGNIHRELQYERILNSRKKDEEEMKANEKKDPKFLRDVMKQVYSVTDENTDTLSERINRNRAYYMKLDDE